MHEQPFLHVKFEMIGLNNTSYLNCNSKTGVGLNAIAKQNDNFCEV